MRNFTRKNVLVIASCAALFFSACGDDSKNAGGSVEDQEVVAVSDKTVTGVSQKGPFVNGSSVTVQELNGETLAQTGLGFEGKIKNDMGEFSVKVNKLESQYALLKANGFYRNEVTGEKSKSQVTLYALTDLSKRDEVNVNLLTHLAYERSLYLAAEEDSSVAGAKKQAETEVLKSFEIEGDFGDAEDLNIFGESDQSAALLAISVLMQGNLSEGDFSERLADYAADIESDGVWNDAKTATQIADWAITQSMSGGLAVIRNNIANWKLSADVPSFEKYVDNFWWQNYGLGTCEKKREGEVMKNQNAGSSFADRYFICKSNLWYEATTLEYDTYKWKNGKDGDAKYGDVVKSNCYVFEDSNWHLGQENDCALDLRGCTQKRQDTVGLGKDKVWYICDDKNWRYATTYEKDTFGWKDSTDGAIKKGKVTDSIYVFDKTAWRAASNVEAKLGGCVNTIADSVGKVGAIYYICKSNKWVEASATEYDTYHWSAGKDGEVRAGQVNEDVYYIYETDEKAWRYATTCEKDTYEWEGLEDASVRKGNVTDTFYVYENNLFRIATEREKYIKEGCTNYNEGSINVQSDTSDYICMQSEWIVYNGILVDSRDGQTYSTVRIGTQIWMNEDLNYSGSDVDMMTWQIGTYRWYNWEAVSGVICPSGWHVPSENEWQKLIDFFGGPKEAYSALQYCLSEEKDKSEYNFRCNERLSYVGEGCRKYGSYCIGDSLDIAYTSGANYWALPDVDNRYHYVYYVTIPLLGDADEIMFERADKRGGFAVRCIKDEDE